MATELSLVSEKSSPGGGEMTSMACTLHPVPSPLGRGCAGVSLAAGDKRESYLRLTVTGAVSHNLTCSGLANTSVMW
jgi:hypothetical protein